MDIFGLLTAGGFVVAVIPHVVNGYRFVTRTRVTKGFWDGMAKDYVIVYPVHEDPSSAIKEPRLIKHETAFAIRKIEEFLKAYGCRVVIKRSNDNLTDEEKGSNVVVIGSSRTNTIVKSLFPELEQFFEFGSASKQCFILDKMNQVCLTSPIDKGIKADLGLIAKIPNRFSKGSANRIYYAAGIHAVGGLGAAEYITSHERLRKLPRCAQDRRLFFVIEARFCGFYNITDFTDYVVPRVMS